MTKLFSVIPFLLFFFSTSLATKPIPLSKFFFENEQFIIYDSNNFDFQIRTNQDSVLQDKKSRAKEKLLALGLCIALGPFGVHRLYLGTSEKVPILYTLTLGGGLGVLPILDFFTILLTNDLKVYKNNTNVFLWTPNKKNKIKTTK